MNNKRYWTQDRIVAELIEAYDVGIPITQNYISSYNGGLDSATKRYFLSIKHAREAVAKKLESQGRNEDARKVRGYRNAFFRWSKEKIIDELIKMYRMGIPLRAQYIQRHDSGFTNQLYYKNNQGKPAYFPSISAAREAAARKLESQGDHAAAAKVRSYNLPIESPNKLKGDKLEKRKKELIRLLNEKIRRKEDVSHGSQQEQDRWFVDQCCKRFGEYRGVFEAAGVDYFRYAKHEKRSRQEYLEMLIQHVCSGSPLDRVSMESIDRRLTQRLNETFSGYYNALARAKEELERRGMQNEAKRIDIDSLFAKSNKERWRTSAEKKQKALEQLVVISSKSVYSPGDIPFFRFEGELTGKELFTLLSESPDWMTTAEFGKRTGCIAENLVHMIYRFAGKAVRYQEGRRRKYLFHISAAKEYRRKNNGREAQKGSLRQVSREMGIGYSKVRNIFLHLGLDLRLAKKGNKVISDKELRMLKEVLEREKAIMEKATKAIIPEKEYSFPELELMEVPVSALRRKAREGNVPYVLDGRTTYLKGSVILDYLANEYAPQKYLSQSSRLLTYFHPHLHTITDFVISLQMRRSIVRKRLLELLKENPNACFRIRKTGQRRRIIASDEVIPFLTNWADKSELQLLDVLRKPAGNPGKGKVQRTIDKLETIVRSEDARLSRESSIPVFECLKILRDYHEETVHLNGADVSNSDLALIHNYMMTHDYRWLELAKSYSLSDVKEMLDDPLLTDKIASLRSMAELALFRLHKGLIFHTARRIGLEPVRFNTENPFYESGEDALRKAIRLYDPSKGAKFSTFAINAIEWAIRNAMKQSKRIGGISLDMPVGDDSKLVDLIGDESAPMPDANMQESQLKKGVEDMLSKLTVLEREVIRRRFALIDGRRETLEEIGFSLRFSKERVRQIEAAALEKLKSNPSAKRLKETYL